VSVIEVENLRVTYAAQEPSFTLAVEALQVAAGEELCIVGGSGSGKTTLLHALSGIIRPASGKVRIAGQDLSNLSEAALDQFRAKHVGYVFQTFNLLQPLSALENVSLAATLAGQTRKAARSAASTLLREMGLESQLDRLPSQLSVGQCQRVALARAMVNQPQLVLADEPTANLDPTNRDKALASLRNSVKELGCALVIVTHEPQVQASFARTLDLDKEAS
jgi:putative ABC transport system ATP-binding protein